MKKLLLALALVTSIAAAPGCATFASTLPIVLADAQDGMLILDALQAFVDHVFSNHPDPTNQALVEKIFAKARTSLDLAIRLASAGKEVDQAQVDAAFKDFEAAYSDLISILGPYGVTVADVPAPRAAPGGGLVVPRPLSAVRAGRR
jgi:hypothetical protein